MEVDQDEVYKGSAAPLLDGIFSGYNATMLAYGVRRAIGGRGQADSYFRPLDAERHTP